MPDKNNLVNILSTKKHKNKNNSHEGVEAQTPNESNNKK